MNNNPRHIVLIPGYMLDNTLWDEFEKYLPAHWSVYHASLASGKTVREIAKHIADRMPHTVTLIGFSLGGYIARQLVADFPDRVDAVVLIASSLREDTPQRVAAMQHLIQSSSTTTFKGLSRSSIARSLHPDRAAESTLLDRIQRMGQRLGYATLVTQSTLQRAGIPAATIRCPTLIIASAEDALRTLDEANELADAIPDATLQVIANSGHLLPLEQPETLATLIVRWLMTP